MLTIFLFRDNPIYFQVTDHLFQALPWNYCSPRFICYLFIVWRVVWVISKFSSLDDPLEWPAKPFKVTTPLSITSTGGSSFCRVCSSFVGSKLLLKGSFCSSTSSEGSSLGFKCSCSVGTGEVAGEARGVGRGVICTWTTYNPWSKKLWLEIFNRFWLKFTFGPENVPGLSRNWPLRNCCIWTDWGTILR